jgi:hypothetical protein
MIRKILTLAITVILVSSCGNDKPVKVEFASLIENPSNYIDKNIKVEGKVVEVCPRTGKELFIVGQDLAIMLKIAAGENSPKFSPDLVGSIISVEGRLEKANSAEKPSEVAKDSTMTKASCCADSAKMGMKKGACCADSAKMSMEKADTVKEAAMCKTEAALAKQSSLSDLIMIYSRHEVVK